MKLNVKSKSDPKSQKVTHEGAVAKNINAEQQLRRSVMSCLLWENEFYEDGHSIAQRIHEYAQKVRPETLANIAIEAREKFNLRHVPLLLCCELANVARGSSLVSNTVERVIQRADELSELLSIFWKDGKKPVNHQILKGLAKAFPKFSAYELAKYNRDSVIKLRDVLFLCHAKPKDEAQALVWKKLVDKTLESPDTWEVSLSAGKDKKSTFERLITESKLGGLALLRNLRNMNDSGVSEDIVKNAIVSMKTDRILPFRFIAASKHAPNFEPELESAMFRRISSMPKLSGKTVVLVDVSGSMDANLSGKSDMTRLDAACGIAMIAREICEDVRVFAFSTVVKEIAPRRGFALKDAIWQSMPHGGTELGSAIKNMPSCNRLIVITDEQSHDSVSYPKNTNNAYMINVGSYANGVGYGKWKHIDGFSESIITWLVESEKSGEINDLLNM